MIARLPFVAAAIALSSFAACSKDDKKVLIDKVVDAASSASAAPAGPKNLDLAKAALATARAKHANKQVADTECGPLQSLAADFADSKDPEAVKTTREIAVFCGIL